METTNEYPEEIVNYLLEMKNKVQPHYKNEQGTPYDCSEIASELKQLCYKNNVPAKILCYDSGRIIFQHGMPNIGGHAMEEPRLEPQRLEGIISGWQFHDVCFARNNEGQFKVLDPVIGTPLTHNDYQSAMFDAIIETYEK